ncbi:MAG TPA: Uma2 family endonuclease [Bryobacteraceae bacterium]|nr:Uma2 family endonuclease [Bryobacteraceae bacterium]
MTVEEFLKLPELEGEKMELVDGEEPGKYVHEITKSNLLHLLAPWLARNSEGKVFCCSMFELNEANSLIPDVSILFPGPILPGNTGLLQGSPDLAIEVISTDKASELEAKIELYLAHGSKSVWVVFPELRAVRIFCADGHSRKFEQNQILEDPTMLPGFQTPVTTIFEGI